MLGSLRGLQQGFGASPEAVWVSRGGSGSQAMVVCCQNEKGHVSFGVDLPAFCPGWQHPEPAAKRGPSSARLIIARVRSARREIPFKGAEGEAGKKGAAAHSPQPSLAESATNTSLKC